MGKNTIGLYNLSEPKHRSREKEWTQGPLDKKTQKHPQVRSGCRGLGIVFLLAASDEKIGGQRRHDLRKDAQ